MKRWRLIEIKQYNNSYWVIEHKNHHGEGEWIPIKNLPDSNPSLYGIGKYRIYNDLSLAVSDYKNITRQTSMYNHTSEIHNNITKVLFEI